MENQRLMAENAKLHRELDEFQKRAWLKLIQDFQIDF
jgi:hypothetical protein